MIEYVDPIPPITRFLNGSLDIRVYGNTFPSNAERPSILVKSSGGSDYSRIQLLARANRDYEAMGALVNAMNFLERSAQNISDLNVLWCSKETLPIPGTDEDTGAAEAWCYMRLDHMEV